MKILFESESTRTYTGDPMKFFGINPIPNGSFVSIGYLVPPVDAHGGSAPTDIFTGGSKSRKYNIPSNDDILVSYIEQYAGTSFAEKMEEIRQTPKYQQVLASGDDTKSVPFDLGECCFVKIGRYNVNWRNEDANANDWKNRTEKLWDLRRKYGFGKDEDEYDETDWRRKEKYNGTGIMPKLGRQITDEDEPTEFLDSDEVSRRNTGEWASPKEGIATYQKTGWGLYAHHDTGRLALRQQVAQVRPEASRWYFVDEAGDMTEISRECANWLCTAYKQIRAKKATEVEAMEADEKAYVNELAALEAMDDAQIKQLLLDRVLYIVGATKLPDGTREPIAYINDESIYVDYPYLDPDVMNGVLSQWVKTSTKDVVELNEAAFTGKFKSANLNESVKRVISKKLNESIEDDEYAENAAIIYNAIAENCWKFLVKLGYTDGDIVVSDDYCDALFAMHVTVNEDEDEIIWDILEDEHNIQIFAPEVLVGEGPGTYVHIDDLNESRNNKAHKKLNESTEDTDDTKFANLLDFFMKEGKMDPKQPLEKCLDKIELVIKTWAKKNDWDEDMEKEIMKYLFTPQFTAVKFNKGYTCTLKAGKKTIKWEI